MKTGQYKLHIHTAGHPLVYQLIPINGGDRIFKFQNTTSVEKLKTEYNIIKITRGDSGEW